MAVNTDVGKLWDVGLNGVGYRLAHDIDGPEDLRYSRQVSVLQDARFVQGEENVRTGVDRYTIHQVLEASGGIGQKYYDRPSSSDTAVEFSENMNPFDEDGVLKPTGEIDTPDDTNSPSYAAALGEKIFLWGYGAGSTVNMWDWDLATQSASSTTASPSGSNSVMGACASSEHWYAAHNGNIYRGTTSTSWGSAWSTVPSTVGVSGLSWVAQRVAYWEYDATADDAVWTTLNDSGAEEVSGGRLTVGFSATPVATIAVDAGQYVYFAISTGEADPADPNTLVYAWDKTSAAPFLAATLRGRASELGLHYMQGNVYAATWETGRRKSIGRIWRCVVNSDGSLTPFLIRETDGNVNSGFVSAFADNGRLVFCSITDYSGSTDVSPPNQIYAIDAASSAAVPVIYVNISAETYVIAPAWLKMGLGDLYFGDTSNEKVHRVTLAGPGGFEDESYVIYSAIDGGTHEDKVFDEISVSLQEFSNQWTVYLDYSTDGGDSWTNAVSSTTDGIDSLSATPGVTARSLQLRVRFSNGGSATLAPEIVGTYVKYHPLGSGNHDTLIRLPLNVGSDIRTLNGAHAPGNGPGAAKSRLDALEALVGTELDDFQDIDWVSGNEETVEVMDVRVVDMSLSQQSASRRADVGQVAMVTLRKVG